MTDCKTSLLGKPRWKMGRAGLASSYGEDERCIQMAFELDVNYLYWGSMRTATSDVRGLLRAIALWTHYRPQAATIANNNGNVDVLHSALQRNGRPSSTPFRPLDSFRLVVGNLGGVEYSTKGPNAS